MSGNFVIGFINIPESHADIVDMSNVMSIAIDSGPETTWLNNIPFAELSRSAHAHRPEYVYQGLDVPIRPSLSENPDITGQLVDFRMLNSVTRKDFFLIPDIVSFEKANTSLL